MILVREFVALCVVTVLVKGVGYLLVIDVSWTHAAITAVALRLVFMIAVLLLLSLPEGRQ